MWIEWVNRIRGGGRGGEGERLDRDQQLTDLTGGTLEGERGEWGG